MHPATLALAFVNQRPFTNAAIIGATSLDQLKTDINSINTKLTDDVLAEIEKIFCEDSIPFNLGTWN